MKKITNMAAQGDVIFLRISALPAKLSEAKPENGRFIVAHSETGHHHALEAVPGVMMYVNTDPLVCYLQLAEEADVVHHRAWDTHETIRLDPGVYEVRRQREYTPDGWRRVED